MRLVVVDVETTGLEDDDAVVEIAVAPVDPPSPPWSSLVWPARGVPPEASAVHHLRAADLEGAPDLLSAAAASPLAGGAGVLAAHNAAFDSAFVPVAPRVGWLCTWRCAMHLWPDAPAHGNQVLRYWLPGLDDELRAIAPGLLVPHRALADALVTSLVLARLARLRPVEDLVALTLEPVLLRVVRFGKHRGELWSEVPRDYLRWVLRAGDFDADVVHTARTHLG